MTHLHPNTCVCQFTHLLGDEYRVHINPNPIRVYTFGGGGRTVEEAWLRAYMFEQSAHVQIGMNAEPMELRCVGFVTFRLVTISIVYDSSFLLFMYSKEECAYHASSYSGLVAKTFVQQGLYICLTSNVCHVCAAWNGGYNGSLEW